MRTTSTPDEQRAAQRAAFAVEQQARDAFRQQTLRDLSHKTTIETYSPAGVTTLHGQVQTQIRAGNFQAAFLPLRQLKDHYQGVHTTLQAQGANKHALLIRDARPQQFGRYQCEASYYDYAMLGLNYLEGLIDLLEIENARREAAGESDRINIAKAKQDLALFAQQYYAEITPDSDSPEARDRAEQLAEEQFGRFFHDAVLPYYHALIPDLSEEAAIDQLRIARDFANMKQVPYAVATISRTHIENELQVDNTGLPHIDTVELELPLLKLTDTQVRMYRDRANQDWYKGQTDFVKALIDKYADRIIEGRMIPAQLIHHLIGTRNGFEKVTAVLNPSTPGNEEVVNSTYHAGSTGHLTKLPGLTEAAAEQVRLTATQESMKQQEFLTGATKLGVQTLVTPTRFVPNDVALEAQIREASEASQNTDFSNTPLNAGRRLVMPSFASAQKFKTLAEGIVNPYRVAINAHVRTSNSPTPQGPAVDPHILQLDYCLKTLEIALAESESSYHRLIDRKNLNLHIATLSNQIVYLLNNHKQPSYTNAYAQVSGCLSGQDRGGLTGAHTTTQAILWKLAGRLFLRAMSGYSLSRSETKTLKAQIAHVRHVHAMAGHTQHMAGEYCTGQGGTGLKGGTKHAMPTVYAAHTKKQYCRGMGKYNEAIPKNPRRNVFYKKKGFWLGMAGVVLGLALIATGVGAIHGVIVLGASASVAITATGAGLTAVSLAPNAKRGISALRKAHLRRRSPYKVQRNVRQETTLTAAQRSQREAAARHTADAAVYMSFTPYGGYGFANAPASSGSSMWAARGPNPFEPSSPPSSGDEDNVGLTPFS